MSLGAKSEGNCSVDLNSYNERGMDYPTSFSIRGVGKKDHKGEIIPLFSHILSGIGIENVSYDVTIEPSTNQKPQG